MLMSSHTARHGFVSECPFCNGKDVDDVVVTGCPGCGGINGCTCQICPACLQKEYQCRCTYCTRCHKPMSLCDCFIYPDPDPDPTPGGGGSGGGVTPGTDDGDDGSTIIKKPTPLYDKDQYLDYYKKRIEDFKERYPDKEPPSYYEFYGDFYMHEFLDKTFHLLSPEGRVWIDLTLKKLQQEMDNMLLDPEYSGIELNEEKFLDEAFETHVKAYDEAGICKLSVTDKVYIAITVYPVDLFQSRGLEQVAKIGVKQIVYWAANPLEAMQQWNEFKENYRTYIELIKDYLENKQYTDPRNIPTKSTNAEWENMTAEEVFDLLFGDQVHYLQETFGGELPTIDE